MEPEKKPLEPIRTDLFRFVTLRAPQLVDPERRRRVFVHHPNPAKSHFLAGVDTADVDEARRLVRQRLDTFKPVAGADSLRAGAPQMHDFSSWLTRHRNFIDVDEVLARTQKISPLDAERALSIWDNLFYQAVQRNDATVRQACIQLLVANHLVVATRDPDFREAAVRLVQTPRDPLPPQPQARARMLLHRLARAKVVIPKPFTVRRRRGERDQGQDNEWTLTPASVALEDHHLLTLADHRVDGYEQVRRELRVGMSMLSGPKKDLAALAAATGDVADALSMPTKSFIAANPRQGVTLMSAEDLIGAKVREVNRQALRLTRPLPGAVVEQGGAPGAYVVSVDSVEGNLEVLMTLVAPYRQAFVVSAQYEMAFPPAPAVPGKDLRVLQTRDSDLVTLRLFPAQALTRGTAHVYVLKGTLLLDDGRKLVFQTRGSINAKATHGQAKPPGESSAAQAPEPQQGKLFGVSRVGIGVFRRVEQEVCCYVPGEVSRIENILAREYKERHTRSLLSTETIEEESTEVEVENQSDTVSANRNELQTEVANVLDRSSTLGAGASLGVQAKLPGGSTATADAYFDIASSSSSSLSDTEAVVYAQEVTNSALERVLQKTSSKRTSRVLNEYEESNRHGFDNRKGEQHVTGVYRWVDIIYTNRVINYGKRLMYEFLIPEPAKFYRWALENNAKAKRGSGGSAGGAAPEPKPPSAYGIGAAEDINEDNYLELGRLFGVSLEDPITPTEQSISKSFGPGDDPNGDEEPDAKERSYQYKLNFAEFGDLTRYSAFEVESDFNFDYHLKEGSGATEIGTYFILKIHNHTERYDRDNLPESDGTSKAKSRNKKDSVEFGLPDVKNSLSLSVEIKNVYNFAINLVIRLRLDEQETQSWQRSVYDTLMRAYDDMLAEHRAAEQVARQGPKDKGAEWPASETARRTVEQRELQRVAIEQLTQPFGIAMGRDFYRSGECRVPRLEQSRAWEVYSSHVKFFEQAFDWSLMSYLFYPYYWADRCDWSALVQTENATDPVFEAFLQSGMARVVVPVRRGFEDAVDYYMETGDIWSGGGLVLDTDDDLYLSIDEELQEVEGVVAGEWQTRVPTALTIVQGRSVFLEDEGLPCCDRLLDSGVDTRLRPSTALLGGSQPE